MSFNSIGRISDSSFNMQQGSDAILSLARSVTGNETEEELKEIFNKEKSLTAGKQMDEFTYSVAEAMAKTEDNIRKAKLKRSQVFE